MASSTGQWLASFASQLASGTDLVTCDITPVADRTRFPAGFVSLASTEINLDIKTVLDVRWEVTVLVIAKDSETVWNTLEQILVYLVPYTQANAMYAFGVNHIAPLSWEVPLGDNTSNDYVEGRIVFDVRSRYAY